MKILLTIHHFLDPHAGASGITLKLGEEYQKLGHEVYFYGKDKLPLWLRGKAKGVTFPEFVAFHISKLSTDQAIDVVDASTGDAWVWAVMTWYHREKRPLLVTRSHGLEHNAHHALLKQVRRGKKQLSWKYPLYYGGFRLWEVATSLRYADLALFYNQYDLKYAVEKLGIQAEKVHIVSNGIPETFLNLPFDINTEKEDLTISIAQVGSYIPRKGIQYSVPALNTILTRYPQIKVSFLGTGCSEVEVYKDFNPTVRDRVKVVPRYTREMLPTLLKNHQIKLLPSLFEGFPLVLFEAMACGLVPVATAISGPMEVLRNGHDSILVPPSNSKAIEQAIERLIKNHSDLEKLRRHAYATAQQYGWTKIAQQNISLYEEALSEKTHWK